MNHKLARFLAWSIVGFGLLLMCASAVFAYLGRSAIRTEDWDPWYGALIVMLPFVLMLVIAGLVASRLPRNAFGWVFLGQSFFFGALLPVGQYYAIYALLVAEPPLPYAWGMATLSGFAWITGSALLPLFLLLFPTGTLPGPRWRFALWLNIFAYLLSTILIWSLGGEGMAPAKNPDAPHGPLVDILTGVGTVGVMIIYFTFVLALLSLIVRYRQADQVVRQQLKLLIYAAAIGVLYLFSDFFYTAPGAWEPIKEAASFALIPISIGLAIFRYRLYDIDIIIRRTLVYSLLTALLALVYLGTVTLIQSLFQFASGQNSTLALVLSTLGIAALFNPLRRRLQEFIDRRFYRQKYDAEQALAGFAALARSETDLDELSRQMLGVVTHTLQPEQVSLWVVANE